MDATQTEFVESLINLPTEDISIYASMKPLEVMDRVNERGALLNRGNPWAALSKPSRRDLLRSRLGYWKCIGADASALSWLAYGFKFKFHEEPDELEFPNGPSADFHADFLEKETKESLADGSFRAVHRSFAKVINPSHTEPKSSGGLRWIADCRYPNSQCAYARFSLMTLRKNLHNLIQRDDELLVFDLSKAYYSVPAHPDSWPYLCLNTPLGLVCGTVLLFGIGQSPFVFHKITRLIVAFAGTVGLRVMSYLDDFLWFARRQEREEVSTFGQWLLTCLGWKLNEKCDLSPSKCKKFLGLLVDSQSFKFKVPQDKITRVMGRLTYLVADASAHTRENIRELAGLLVSLDLAVPGVRAWTRALYRAIGSGPSHELLTLDTDALEELRFLETHVPLWAPRGLPIFSDVADVSAHSDAGDFGIGGHAVSGNTKISLEDTLPSDLIGTSSTLRELYALHQLVIRNLDAFQGKRVRFFMDSTAAVRNMYSETS